MNYTEQQAEWITQQILQELATSKKKRQRLLPRLSR